MDILQAIYSAIVHFLGHQPGEPLLFFSGAFWLLFILFLAGYAMIYKKNRWMLPYVILFNLFFYYKTNGVLVLLLVATAVMGWWIALQMKQTADQRKRKILMLVAVSINIGVLGYFKYAGFFADSFNTLLGTNFAFGKIFLPVGISFYTFQSISYIVDVYKKRMEASTAFLPYLFYLTFFPLILSGPIVRAPHFFPQLKERPAPINRMLYLGLWLIILGLLKKVMLADYLAQFNNLVLDTPTQYSGFEVLMGAMGYSMQIYLDFSGYSDIAIGLGALLGFDLGENFRFPYRATNLTDFWRRWHISLSTWLRDYIYIPLGGNRKGKNRQYLNNMVTMLIGGLWHGASWMFVCWGALHGAGLVLHKMSLPWLNRLPNTWWVKLMTWMLFYLFVLVTWVFFRCTSMEICGEVFTRMFTQVDWAYLPVFVTVRLGWSIALVVALLGSVAISPRWYARMQEWFIAAPWWVKLVLFTVVIQAVVQLQTSNVQPFLYYQF